MLSLHFYELIKDMLDKVLDKIKKVTSIENVDDTKVLTDTDDKLPDDVTLKNALILITYNIKYDDKFYLQRFLEKALVV